MSSTTDSSTPTSTMSHNRNFGYVTGSIILVLIIVGGYLYYQSAQQKSKASASGSSLQTATVRQGSIVISASGTGQVVAAATANLGFPNTGSSSNTGNGTLTQLNVVVGDQVKAG